MSDFYVYEHWRPDTNQCFYVGKGIRQRARKMLSRNKFHSAIQGKLKRNGLKVGVRIIRRGLTEDEAFALEMELIANWRAKGIELANVGCGGDGQTGLIAWNRSPILCLEDLKIYPSTYAAAEFYGLHWNTVFEVCKEKYRIIGGPHFVYFERELSRAEADAKIIEIEERLANRRRRSPLAKQRHIGIIAGKDAAGRSAAGPASLSKRVVCLDDGRIYSSISEAARVYNVHSSALTELCNGKRGRKSVGGKRFQFAEAA